MTQCCVIQSSLWSFSRIHGIQHSLIVKMDTALACAVEVWVTGTETVVTGETHGHDPIAFDN